MRLFIQKDRKLNVSLWHSPYNGGWIWFDRKQWKRFDCGWRRPTLWWCFAGFCGRLTLQSTPWGKDPGARARKTVRDAKARSESAAGDRNE